MTAVRPAGASGWRALLSPSAGLLLWLPVALITLAHYSTAASHLWLHDLFRRLYYLPIVLGAFRHGLRGALAVALVASAAYVPHAFTRLFEPDPAGGLEKFLEILLYNAVAILAGVLVDRERREQLRQQRITQELEHALGENRRLQEQLVRAGKLKALGELTAAVAHELKNPLASIQGAAEAIADEIPADSPRRRLVEIQNKEIARLGQTLERFLSFARPQAVLGEPVDLAKIASQVRELVEHRARQQDVSITVENNGAQPVTGDADRLQQVVLNLALNALDAMPQGGRLSFGLHLEQGPNGREQVFEVADTGPGIPREEAERIFDPFYTNKENGTGLGLSISERIVEEHGGYIELAPAAEGACFRIHLPLAERGGHDPGDSSGLTSA